ncbi:pyridoxal phosphate-dependent aminotransferase [Candidatus Uabimicrobium amorphum]|uniref:Aminotransferase n=1 Tax=Uabimicrobium amorphum TaxID=2596890 RepID=A0A5S9F1S3_UABAM|nr:pyridoxal phosphate-dependent aminotransferase [Candidatus Uabimicrobium amorphum]BBM82712.1 aminotransferase [Candidatus Uabimicrobium amorphum]
MHPISLNLSTRGRKTSATIRINERSKELQKNGREIYFFGLGQSPFPVPNCVIKALQDNAHQKDYLHPQGLWELREAVAAFHRDYDQVAADAQHVLIGPGSKELMFILQLAFYGDIITPSPCWVSYRPQAEIIGRNNVSVLTTYKNRWRIQAEDLEKLCEDDSGRPRLIILNYPGNPEGQTYTEEELQAIAETARKHKIIVLSDEIYGLLNFSGKHTSIARYYPEGTIISSGISKWCGAGGWRLGTFVFPPQFTPLLKSMVSIASETFTSVSAPIQYAAIRAYEMGEEIEVYLQNSRKVLQIIATHCYEKLSDAGVDLWEAQGGFYLFLNFSKFRDVLQKNGIHDSGQLCERLLEETGVAILPGSDFLRCESEYTVRMAYVDFDGKKALEACEKSEPDEKFLSVYCPKIQRGIEKMTEWIKRLS